MWLDRYGEDATYDSVKVSLDKLGTDYVDLMLLHQPFNDVYGAWRGLERAQKEGLIAPSVYRTSPRRACTTWGLSTPPTPS